MTRDSGWSHAYTRTLMRLAALEDERAILEVLHRLTHCLDYGLDNEFVELFTHDGVFEVTRRGDDSIRRAGHDELAQYMANHTRAPDRFHKHLLLNPVISIMGENAVAESYFVLLDEGQQGPLVRTYGRYRDDLVKCPGGWRVRMRLAEIEVRAPDID